MVCVQKLGVIKHAFMSRICPLVRKTEREREREKETVPLGRKIVKILQDASKVESDAS